MAIERKNSQFDSNSNKPLHIKITEKNKEKRTYIFVKIKVH